MDKKPGRPRVGNTRDKTLSLRMREIELQELKELSKIMDTSRTEAIVIAVREKLKNIKK